MTDWTRKGNHTVFLGDDVRKEVIAPGVALRSIVWNCCCQLSVVSQEEFWFLSGMSLSPNLLQFFFFAERISLYDVTIGCGLKVTI